MRPSSPLAAATVLRHDPATGLFVAQLIDKRCAVMRRVSGGKVEEGAVVTAADLAASGTMLLMVPATGSAIYAEGSGQLVTRAQAMRFLREHGGRA